MLGEETTLLWVARSGTEGVARKVLVSNEGLLLAEAEPTASEMVR